MGKIPQLSFTPKEHFELGEALGMMDFNQAAQIAGSRYVILKKELALLERALATFMIDVHTQEFGYELVSPPLLVKSESMYGTGQLPKLAEDAFQTTNGHWLIPTSEVSLTCLAANQILEEEILKRLKLPYRVMNLCSADIGFSSKKTYDLEVWLPGQNCYREISSCSLCGDFQARRMKARYRKAETKKVDFIHTLNGSGIAVGRALIAVLENYQTETGSIKIPKVLIPYMNGKTEVGL